MARRPTRKKIARGKTWFTLHAPKIFNENEIGQTLGKDGDSIIGRTIKMPLSEISGDITKHNVKLRLGINKVVGEHAYTEILSYELSKPYLQRMIRRRVSKIEVINDLKLKNGQKYRIKTIGITLHRADASQKTALRKEIYKEIENVIPPFDIETLVVALSTGKIQREIQKKVSKIYPLRFLDIRKIEILKEKKAVGLGITKPQKNTENTPE